MRLIAVLFFILFASPCLAANVNINNLPVASSVQGADLYECEQSGVNHQCTPAQLQAYLATVFGTFATQNAPTGLTQCLHANSAGVVSGTGVDCGSGGGGGTPGGSNGQVQYNNSGTFGGLTSAQLTALINTATTSNPGALPPFPGTTTTFFRGDGTYDTLNVGAVSGAAPLASPTFTGTLTFPITGSTQCLTVNTSGTLSGFGAPCPAGANPTGTASNIANNGTAPSFMRSDATPAIQLASNTQFGLAKVDNSTIIAIGGVISAPNSGGTVTSVAAGCGVSTGGSPITTTGTVSASPTINAQTGTSYTVQATDCGSLITLSNASAVGVNLPVATGSFAAPYYTTVVNIGVGTVTITPTTSTINGTSNLSLTSFQSVDIYSVGGNYIATTGKSSGSATITAGSTVTSGITSGDVIGTTSNLVVDTGVAWTNLPLINGTNNFTGTNVFGAVVGKVTTQAGATYTFSANDCGTEVTFSSSSAITTTIPATLAQGCNIAVAQIGTGRVTYSGSAVTPATVHTAHSYTGTFAQWSIMGINIEANAGGSSAIAILTGDGS